MVISYVNWHSVGWAIVRGFYDQAHYIREIKRYTGYSPLKLVECYK